MVSYNFAPFVSDLRTAFNLIDKNQDGRVTADELQYMLNKLDIYVDEEVAQDLIRCASRTGIQLCIKFVISIAKNTKHRTLYQY